MSASLIGRSGSSAFRLSTTTTVSMSLAGSCFSSESALRPFHRGIRRRGGIIFGSALPPPRPVALTKRGADILVRVERLMDEASRALGPMPSAVSANREKQTMGTAER